MIKMFDKVDCHTHILPQMDDGAQNVQFSVDMLKMLLTQGVNTVFLTPHFYSYKESAEDFLARRENSFHILEPYAEELGMNLIPASEAYLTDYIFSNEDISALCINSGKFILTELPFETSFSQNTMRRIEKLINTYDVIPVFAHIERYPILLKDSGCLDTLIDMGCLAQINLSSLFGGLLQRRKLLKYIENNLVQIVGTDCHNLSSRAPCYWEGIEVIEKKLGQDYVTALNDNAIQVIQGR